MDAFYNFCQYIMFNTPFHQTLLDTFRVGFSGNRVFAFPNGTKIREYKRHNCIIFTDFPNEDYNNRQISYEEAKRLIKLFKDELEKTP